MDAAKYLILIRHSISAPQPEVASHAWTLTEGGRALCLTLAARLRAYAPTVIATSAEPKAMLTAELVAAQLGVPHEIEPGLGEHARHHAAYFADQASFRATIHDLLTQPDELVYGEETGTQAYTRFRAAVDRLLARHPGTFAAVTHGTVLALYLHRVAGVEPVAFWEALGMPAYVVLHRPSLELVEIQNNP